MVRYTVRIESEYAFLLLLPYTILLLIYISTLFSYFIASQWIFNLRNIRVRIF